MKARSSHVGRKELIVGPLAQLQGVDLAKVVKHLNSFLYDVKGWDNPILHEIVAFRATWNGLAFENRVEDNLENTDNYKKTTVSKT